MIRLANPSFLLIGVIFLPLFLWRKAAYLGYSQLSLLEGEGRSRIWQNLPVALSVAIVVLLMVGLARPQKREAVKQERFLARDIILVIDLSYSMENTFNWTGGPRKIEVAKKAALEFIQKRENDRIGLLVFGDETFGSWPLTKDLDLISKKINRLGMAFYGGTNLAEPFLRVAEHFREMGQSANRILVFLSDGEARINDKKKAKITEELRQMDVHLYLVGINLRQENSDVLEVVDRVGGRFIDAGSPSELTAAFEAIDRLEPSMVEIEVQGEIHELYPIPVFAALCLMLFWRVLRSTLFIELC